jgi:exodeoxyribonuclease VII large subunit
MDDAQQRMSLAVGSRLRTLHRRLLEIHQNLDAFRPTTVLLRLRQLIARQEHGLLRAHASLVGRRREHLNTLAVRLGAAHPRHAIRLNRERIESLAARLDRAMLTDLRNRQEQISSLQRHIEAVSPQHVLQRGYTITTLKKQGTLVWTAASIKGGERLVTRFADGQIESVAQDPRQPELFE